MAIIDTTDVHIKEVLVPVIENWARNNSALIQLGLAKDATGEVNWSDGGNHITRPEFRGKITASKKTSAGSGNAPATQKVTYSSVKYPCATSISSVAADGNALEDAFDNAGVFNRLVNHIRTQVLQDLDDTLLTYTVDIGDGSTNYGAQGTGLSLDISAEDTTTLCYDALVRARAKFGDNPGPCVLLANSKCMTDLLLTTEAKNMQQGIVIGNQTGVMFPSLGIVGVMTDKITVSNATYANLLCKAGCMSYAWKNPLKVKTKYNGNDEDQWDFIWRFAIMRNQDRQVDTIVKLITATAQS